MTDDPIQPLSEALADTTESLLGRVPVFGVFMDLRAARLRRDFERQVGQFMRRTERRLDLGDERHADMAMKILEVANKTRHEEKLRALEGIMANFLDDDRHRRRDSLHEYFVRLIDVMPLDHLVVFAAIAEAPAGWKAEPYMWRWKRPDIYRAVRLRIAEGSFRTGLSDVESRGLIEFSEGDPDEIRLSTAGQLFAKLLAGSIADSASKS